MKDIRQTARYSRFMEAIGWKWERIDNIYIYSKKFPLVGVMIKIQRPAKLPKEKLITELIKKYRPFSFLIEFDNQTPTNHFPFTNGTQPNIATKTIHIDLTPSETEIFNNFSESKRRAIRRAQKYGVQVEINQDIATLLNVKNRAGGLFGFMATSFVKPLWRVFAPDQVACVLAYPNNSHTAFACIFLIWAQGVAYYWIAGATRDAKKQFAPTLLVWEALKHAKAKGNTLFDFEGIYDERFPEHTDWLGFTKFKEGFGGNVVYFPKPVKIK